MNIKKIRKENMYTQKRRVSRLRKRVQFRNRKGGAPSLRKVKEEGFHYYS